MRKNHELASISAKVVEWEKELKELPSGTFVAAKNGRFYKWYRYLDGHKELVKKTNVDLARSYAHATFLKLCIKDAKNEMAAINSYLQKTKENESEKYIDNPEIRNLLKLPLSIPDKVAIWMASDYPKSSRPYKGTLYKIG